MSETATAARPTAAEDAQAQPDPRRWLALLTVLTASFMVLLDISIVNVAIPSIQNNLHASFGEVQFVIAGYSLAYAVVLITGGRLGDIHGRKRLFMIGMTGFVVASALCGLAQSPLMLVLSRVLQGVMAALMYPQVLSVIQVTFPPRERGAAFGIFGAVIGLATILGPVAGGLIIRDDITGNAWRWVFLVNVPVGVLSLIAATRLLKESRAPQATRLDLLGVAIVSAGLFLLVYPLVEGRDAGWPAWTFICLAVSPAVLAVFAVVERGRQDRSPLILLSLLRNRSFRIGLFVTFLFLAGVPAFFFTFGLTLQIGLGFTALRAALTTIPFAVGSASASALSVRLAPRLGKWILVAGCAILVAGMAGIVATIHARGTDLSGPELIPALLVAGVGLGSVVAPLLNIILAGVTGPEAGSASGLLTTIQQIGAAVGVAVIGVVFFGLVGGRAAGAAEGVHPQLRGQLEAAHLPAGQVAGAEVGFDRCFTDRANSKDPSETPPSCPQQAASSPAGQAFASAGRQALGTDFASSFERTLFVNMAIWVVTGLLAVALPTRRPQGAPGAAGGH